VKSFGVLRFAQDDSKNRQQQEQTTAEQTTARTGDSNGNCTDLHGMTQEWKAEEGI
jgi:hypothetical protein